MNGLPLSTGLGFDNYDFRVKNHDLVGMNGLPLLAGLWFENIFCLILELGFKNNDSLGMNGLPLPGGLGFENYDFRVKAA